MTTKTGLAYAIYLKYSWDGEGEERGHYIFNLLGVGVASVNTESQRNFFLGSASFQVEIAQTWGVLRVLYFIAISTLVGTVLLCAIPVWELQPSLVKLLLEFE